MKHLLAVVIMLWSAPVFAEPASLPKEAEELAAKLSDVKTYQADFSMETKEEDGKPVKLEGKISFKTPNQRRLEIKQDDTGGLPQVIVADGKLEWHYDPNTAQVLRSELPGELPGPHLPFGEVHPGTLRFVEKSGSGKEAVYRFEGTPATVLAESSPVPIKVIRLDVSGEDGFLRHLVLLDEKGAEVLSQNYNNLRINANIPASDFIFTPPEGVPVKDLSAPVKSE